ncbi:hypothetical protein I79_003267 [Cricetulus griseus]|uniref:Uncharacterized protein n=1 Tax=Cricetulus griseus TaxID=10029 RepID=G3GZJ5_CRIGR|nr:hypothetical protein I79_003267 [Cricetulus griseus]
MTFSNIFIISSFMVPYYAFHTVKVSHFQNANTKKLPCIPLYSQNRFTGMFSGRAEGRNIYNT